MHEDKWLEDALDDLASSMSPLAWVIAAGIVCLLFWASLILAAVE